MFEIFCGFSGETDQKLLGKMMHASMGKKIYKEEIFTENGINIGAGYLIISKLNKGDEVLYDNDGIHAVFSGEMYNFTELKLDLKKKGYEFSINSNAEMIAFLYREYGADFIVKINGAFAIILWDNAQRKLFLFRDRLGEKNIYYLLRGKRIIFSSEMRIILEAPFYKKEIDFESLHHYFSFRSIPQPRSIFKDIQYVLPGELLMFKDGILKKKKYWNCTFGDRKNVDEKVLIPKMSDLFSTAIKDRICNEIQPKVLLSGGLDSSSIVATLSGLSKKALKTFHLNYGKKINAKLADVVAARKVAKLYKTDHQEYLMGPKEIMRNIKKSIEVFDEPLGVFVPFSFFANVVDGDGDVVFSGNGGDEVFGGYDYHRTVEGQSSDTELLQKYIFNFYDFNESEKQEIYSDSLRRKMKNFNSIAIWKEYFQETTSRKYPDKIFEIDIKNIVPEQTLYISREVGTHFSFQPRAPFLDYRLIELAASLKGEIKVKNNRNKHLLKELIKNCLPYDIINRPKDVFTLSADQCLMDNMKKNIKDILAKERLEKHGFLNIEVVNELVRDYYTSGVKKEQPKLRNSAHLADKIFILMIFQLWWEHHFDENNLK
ncbi:MAG: asparagine synthase (glutamine-hydrolyzing) [Candidatus Moranbacteria bacterium]|nr:asparagine synthase (glutamine-hydrolyzing) [Candidatus Moranbacteria bacterium]